MFRYIGFSWNSSATELPALAQRLEQALCGHGWRGVLVTAGLRVYVTGQVPRVNGAYVLPANQGVILGRLFRRSAPVPEPVDVDLSHAESRRIVQSDGRALIDLFWGRYVAFLPSSAGQPRVLRDPTGTLPCYRLELHGVNIVLSWLEDLPSLIDIGMPSVDWQAVGAHMVLGTVSGRATLLGGVTQLLAGEMTPMSSDDGPPERLWSAADCARRASSRATPDAAALLREAVARCVRSWAACYGRIVLRLSGGVDSAILLGNLAAEANAGDVVCLNYYAAGTDSDERRYARRAAQRVNATLIERTVDDGFRLEDVLQASRTPLPANYLGFMASSRTDAQVARLHQAGAVFNGAGGDQLFFEVQCTWPAADYLRDHGFNPGLLEAALDAAHLGNVSFWKALGEAVTSRSFRGNPLDGAGRHLTLMHPDAMAAALATAPRFIHPGWLDAQDLPIGKFHQLGMLITPFEYYDHYLRDAAPERVQPLMSQPLLELCLATPTYVLTKGGRGRALARHAFAGLLPPEIAARRSKGGAADYIEAVLQRNLPFARGMLLEGQLARHRLLDRRRVEAALAGRLASRTTYVTEIHACIATEAWLQIATSARAAPG